jgi:hypothetical protein
MEAGIVDGRTVEESSTGPNALKYTRRLYENVIGWYKNADFKAQVVLTLNGAFISFLTGSIFLKRSELSDLLSVIGPETFLLFAILAASIGISIIFALCCLYSRHKSAECKKEIRGNTSKLGREDGGYPPDFMWFFECIRHLDKNRFRVQLNTLDEKFEIDALANEISILSENVSKKHTWVNSSFVGFAVGLLAFLGMAISYVVRISFV